MNIEEVRDYALSLNEAVTEKLFAEVHVAFCIGGKWFMLMSLDEPEGKIALKLPPDEAEQLRAEHEGILPAYHMNKKHWSDLYLDRLSSDLVKQCISKSFCVVASKLPKKDRPEGF